MSKPIIPMRCLRLRNKHEGGSLSRAVELSNHRRGGSPGYNTCGYEAFLVARAAPARALLALAEDTDVTPDILVRGDMVTQRLGGIA